MRLVDTHVHLDDEQFDGILDEVIRRALDAGVIQMIAVGTTLASSQACVSLAERHDCVRAAVGIHPNYCQQASQGDWDQIVRLAEHSRVVALGETGLDRYWDYAPFPLQQDYFDRHLQLSQDLDLPVVIHMRETAEDILFRVREAVGRGPLRGVMHSFTADAAMAARYLDLGLHISFAGMVTFKKSTELREVAASIPGDRILIETDAPYLSPHPHRGQRPNEPALMAHTAACLAQVRGVSLAEFAESTTNNALALFDRR